MRTEDRETTRIASWSFTLPTSTRLRRYDHTSSSILRAGVDRMIPRGAGRSYGDAAYVTNGVTLSSASVRRVIDFDPVSGSVECESGVEMGALHRYLEQTDWSFPVYGGTQWATIGGAIAADIHGKNDPSQGSFGHHVRAIEVLVPSGDLVRCTPTEHADLFAATIGGMGLTGFVKSVELQLQRAVSRTVHMRSETLGSVPESVERLASGDDDFDFVSCVKPAASDHRSLHAWASIVDERHLPPPRPALEIPLPTLDFKRMQLMHVSMGWFRAIQLKLYGDVDRLAHIRGYNYIGLHEVIKNVNHLLGPFIEYQFVVPTACVVPAWDELARLAAARSVTYRGYVLKRLGDRPRAGLLSFPTEGITVSVFAADNEATRTLFHDFTDALIEMGGRVYLAKDSCVSAIQFEKMYDQLDVWRDIVARYDPDNRVQSDMSIRLGMKPW